MRNKVRNKRQQLRRRYLVLVWDLQFRAQSNASGWAERVYRWLDGSATSALYNRDHAEGGAAAAEWHGG